MKTFKPSYFPAILWFLLTTWLLIIPGTRFPSENWFDKIWLDKWVHIGLFSIMVWLWCRAILRLNKSSIEYKKWFLIIAITWLAYGTGMEFVQKYFVPNRSFDAGDIIADGVGCLFGYLFSLRSYLKK